MVGYNHIHAPNVVLQGYSSMSENASNAINSNALHAKSKVYIGRALRSKDAGEFDEYQLSQVRQLNG